MTRKQLEERVEFWRARIIPELRVMLMDHPPPDDPDDGSYMAIVQTDWAISEARIFFCKELLRRDQAQVDRVIVHELLHPLLDRVLDTVEVLEEHVPPAVWRAFVETRRIELEHFTDRIAHQIADPVSDDDPFGTFKGRSKPRS